MYAQWISFNHLRTNAETKDVLHRVRLQWSTFTYVVVFDVRMFRIYLVFRQFCPRLIAQPTQELPSTRNFLLKSNVVALCLLPKILPKIF